MIKENLGQFEDGSVMKHPATVVGTISTGIVLQDDADIFICCQQIIPLCLTLEQP